MTTTPDALRLEWRNPADLQDHPDNPRVHPARQSAATETLIFGESGVGWAGALLLNERTGFILNGHDRKQIAIKHGERVPVLVGSWSEEQERLILSTHDYVGALAKTDPGRMARLVSGMQEKRHELTPLYDRLKSVKKLIEAPKQKVRVPVKKHVLSIVLDTPRHDVWERWKRELGYSTDQRAMEAVLSDQKAFEFMLAGKVSHGG